MLPSAVEVHLARDGNSSLAPNSSPLRMSSPLQSSQGQISILDPGSVQERFSPWLQEQEPSNLDLDIMGSDLLRSADEEGWGGIYTPPRKDPYTTMTTHTTPCEFVHPESVHGQEAGFQTWPWMDLYCGPHSRVSHLEEYARSVGTKGRQGESEEGKERDGGGMEKSEEQKMVHADSRWKLRGENVPAVRVHQHDVDTVSPQLLRAGHPLAAADASPSTRRSVRSLGGGLVLVGRERDRDVY